MDFQSYPLDVQQCKINILSCKYITVEAHVRFVFIPKLHVEGEDLGLWCHFQQYFSYIVAVSVIRKPLTCRKSLINFIT